MASAARPVLVAYDGSEPARNAVRAAAELFPGRPLLVISVWEVGLAMEMAPARDPTGLTFGMLPSAEEVMAVDRAQHDRAIEVAEEGAGLARELGASATALPVAQELDPAHTIAALADDHDARAIVVGSRGLGGMASRFLGSVSREVLSCAERPVLVVKASPAPPAAA
jgi:nucleotide-binding universal stress UspA family protein